MKKTYKVVIEKTVEIDIPDEHLSSQDVEDFERHMFPVETAEDIVKYAAEQVAMFGDDQFIDGVGRCATSNMAKYYAAQGEDIVAVVKVLCEDWWTEE